MRTGGTVRWLVPACASLIAASACDGNAVNRDVELVSAKLTTKSHFPDTNCMACHQRDDRTSPDRNTVGFFTLAGTIRETNGMAQPNFTVILYDALYDVDRKVAGNEVMRLDADALGMFYTTRPIPLLGSGPPEKDQVIFPAVLDPSSGIIKHMYKGVANGSCNICHHDNYMDMSPRDDVAGDPWDQLP